MAELPPADDQHDLRIKVRQIQSERLAGEPPFTAEQIAERLGIGVGSRSFKDVEKIVRTCFLCGGQLTGDDIALGRQTCAKCVKSMGEQQPE